MDGGKGAIYYPNPKAASTSLIHFMTSGAPFYFSPAQSGNFSFDYGHLSEYYNEETVRCGFTFVRDPLKRLISGYYTFMDWIKRNSDGLRDGKRSSFEFEKVGNFFSFFAIFRGQMQAGVVPFMRPKSQTSLGESSNRPPKTPK